MYNFETKMIVCGYYFESTPNVRTDLHFHKLL